MLSSCSTSRLSKKSGITSPYNFAAQLKMAVNIFYSGFVNARGEVAARRAYDAWLTNAGVYPNVYTVWEGL
jgi:hypothetical protein